MTDVNILSLPIEIIQVIGDVGKDCLRLKTLRLVCSQFNLAFEAQVLSTLVILVTFDTLQPSLDMLLTFASQDKITSRAIQHARTLRIKFLSPDTSVRGTRQSRVQLERQSQDLSPSFPSASSICRLVSTAISSLKRRLDLQ